MLEPGLASARGPATAPQATGLPPSAPAAGPVPPRPAAADAALATAPVVRALAVEPQASVGERVSIAIDITSGTDVSHVPFHLDFDPHVLHFDHGEEGGFLASDGGQTAFFAAEATGGGSVVVGLSRLGRASGVDGTGTLCVLRFTAVGRGNATFGFSHAKVRDSSNRIVPAVFEPASVVVQ